MNILLSGLFLLFYFFYLIFTIRFKSGSFVSLAVSHSDRNNIGDSGRINIGDSSRINIGDSSRIYVGGGSIVHARGTGYGVCYSSLNYDTPDYACRIV